MSRIADVLEKARRERAGGSPSDKQADANEPVLRAAGDIQVPWELKEGGTVAPVQSPAPGLGRLDSGPAAWDSGVGTLGSRLAAREMPVDRPAPTPPAPIAPRPGQSVAPAIDDETMGLARRLFLQKDVAGGSAKRVLLIAVDSARASSEIAIGLARAVAREAGRSVCLLDLNLDGGTLHHVLRLHDSPGVSDAILQGMLGPACTQEVPSAPSLCFMPTGSRPEELRAAIRDAQTQEKVRALLGMFGYVVACAAPESKGDAAALGACFDGVVLVLDAHATTPEAARATASALTEAGVKLLGSVVNRGKNPSTPTAR
jgi:protein-tyrosine kinase